MYFALRYFTIIPSIYRFLPWFPKKWFDLTTQMLLFKLFHLVYEGSPLFYDQNELHVYYEILS